MELVTRAVFYVVLKLFPVYIGTREAKTKIIITNIPMIVRKPPKAELNLL
jgi:hypothetical protein